jgi:hypothetical protein
MNAVDHRKKFEYSLECEILVTRSRLWGTIVTKRTGEVNWVVNFLLFTLALERDTRDPELVIQVGSDVVDEPTLIVRGVEVTHGTSVGCDEEGCCQALQPDGSLSADNLSPTRPGATLVGKWKVVGDVLFEIIFGILCIRG